MTANTAEEKPFSGLTRTFLSKMSQRQDKDETQQRKTAFSGQRSAATADRAEEKTFSDLTRTFKLSKMRRRPALDLIS